MLHRAEKGTIEHACVGPKPGQLLAVVGATRGLDNWSVHANTQALPLEMGVVRLVSHPTKEDLKAALPGTTRH